MRKLLFSLICIFLLNINTLAQDESLAPGINDRYKQRPEQALEQFHFATRDLSLQKEILEAIGLKPGMDVADVGAGDGTHARIFAEKVSPEGKVYAVEIVQEFLDHIRTVSDEKGIKNVRCILGSDTSCNLGPSSVDVVYTCDTYHHFEYPFKMMASIYKALRPNGQFIIIDFKDKSWHVRADSKTVIEEITNSGFELIENRDAGNMFFLARFTVVK